MARAVAQTLSRQRAIFISVAVTAVSLVALVFTASMHHGVPTTALTNVSAVFFSLGIVSIVYEIYLRQSVLQETLAIAGLKQSVIAAGLIDIGGTSIVRYEEMCEDASRVDILLINPIGWVEREWVHLVKAANLRPLSITVYLPDPQSSALPEVACRQGYPPDEFASQCRHAKEALESSWKGEKLGATAPARGATFNIKYYEGVPGYEIVNFGTRVVTIMPRAVSTVPGAASFAMILRSGTTISDVLTAQLRELDGLPDVYADEVK